MLVHFFAVLSNTAVCAERQYRTRQGQDKTGQDKNFARFARAFYMLLHFFAVLWTQNVSTGR